MLSQTKNVISLNEEQYSNAGMVLDCCSECNNLYTIPQQENRNVYVLFITICIIVAVAQEVRAVVWQLKVANSIPGLRPAKCRGVPEQDATSP